jgi:hypothetical protein
MVNDRSVLITAAQLTKFLEKRGKTGHFVDLSLTQFATGPGHEPDLKEIASTVPEMKVKGEVKNMAAGTSSKKPQAARYDSRFRQGELHFWAFHCLAETLNHSRTFL